MRKRRGLEAVAGVALSMILAACGTVPGPAPARDEPLSLRIMTFNIRYDNPADGANAWPMRKEMAAQMIDFQRIDIAGLQEALASQIRDLRSFLPDYAWVGVGRDDGKEAGEFCPVFFLRDRLRLLESSTFWLSEEPAKPGLKGWDAACARVVTWARLEDLRSGRTLVIFNTHLDHVGKRARQESAALILSAVRKIAAGEPAILTGDFNCTRADPAYKALVAADKGAGAPLLRDAREASRRPPFGPSSTFNGFRADLPGRPPIDHIFVGQGVAVLRVGVLPGARDGRYVSDHNPVLAEIRLARR
jgi:endonuclease/exonuclease/phosphatase family metal-dependent hydrolase